MISTRVTSNFRARVEARDELAALARGPGMALTSDTPSIRYVRTVSSSGWYAARRSDGKPEMFWFAHLAQAARFVGIDMEAPDAHR